MSFEYLKNRSSILAAQEKEAELRQIDEINKNYFIKEGVYNSVVYPAIKIGVEEGVFSGYKIKKQGEIEIFLTDEPEDENLGWGYLLEIKQDSVFLKLELTHNVNGMYSLNEIDIEKELYKKDDATYSFLHTLGEMFESIDRQENDD
ncbi:hypothetical protein [Capnocytophaga sputigena]|jgi:hypothetical protein|uniref:hypothetical protein n=1 Tax=Capnocytophaga sputigena TaxID=1019 RepID=UPI00248E3F3C|nr:hypothetical protein [Capnocytophaga sputigena]